MFCYKCGEENPDEAKYCRNCGATLKKEETVKKVEVIEAPNDQQNTNRHCNNRGNNCLGFFKVFQFLHSQCLPIFYLFTRSMASNNA